MNTTEQERQFITESADKKRAAVLTIVRGLLRKCTCSCKWVREAKAYLGEEA